jgi:hypothetical protein
MLIGYAGFSTDDQKSRRLEKWFGGDKRPKFLACEIAKHFDVAQA